MAKERLQKILARAGIASRRAAEELIVSGRVRVNGRVVTELGTQADRDDKVEVDGKRTVAESAVYIVLHKPRGVVSTMSDPEGRPTVRDLLHAVPARVFPIGRLDFATSGVLLVTNDGDFSDGLMHPRQAVPKTYVLKVKGKMDLDDVGRWRTGVMLEDGITLPAEAKLLRYEEDKTWLELTIREGRNQQIRRMGEATGFRVMRLARVSFADISSEGVKPGEWRYLSRDELATLKQSYGVPRRAISPPAPAAQPRRVTRPQAEASERESRARGQGRSPRSRERAPREAGASTERTERAYGQASARDEHRERGPATAGARGRGREQRPVARDERAPAPTGARGRGRERAPREGKPSERAYGRAPVREERSERAPAPTPRPRTPERAAPSPRPTRGDAPKRPTTDERRPGPRRPR